MSSALAPLADALVFLAGAATFISGYLLGRAELRLWRLRGGGGGGAPTAPTDGGSS